MGMKVIEAAFSGDKAISGQLEVHVDIPSARAKLVDVKKMMDGKAKAAKAVGLDAPLDGEHFDSAITVDKDFTQLYTAQFRRTTLHFLGVQTSMDGVNADLRKFAAKGGKVRDFAASVEMRKAMMLNKVNNARVAAMMADAIGLPISMKKREGDHIGIPISTWVINKFDDVDITSHGKPASTLTFFNNTYNTASSEQRGILLKISPTEGVEWLFGPKSTAPVGSIVGGGSWKNEDALNMFPTGTGRVVDWDDLGMEDLNDVERELLRSRAGVGGKHAVTRRLAPRVYAPLNLEDPVYEKLGWNPKDGHMTLQAEAVFVGAPPAEEMDLGYHIKWTPSKETVIPVPIDHPIITYAVEKYADEQLSGQKELFGEMNLSLLFSAEKDGTYLMRRDFVQKLWDAWKKK